MQELPVRSVENVCAGQGRVVWSELRSDGVLTGAIKTKLVDPELKIQKHRRGTSPRLSAREQQEAVDRVVHTDELTPRDRAASILVLVFGQQIQDVVGLTWDHVQVTDELITVQVGRLEIALPPPLDEPWRQLAANPGHGLTAAHPFSNWVFRGTPPGRHLDPGHLRRRLQEVFRSRAARLGTLHELTKLAPIAVLAEALDYSPGTLERHAVDSANGYARYVASVREV
jgi:integrase